ncbi:ATP-binding protein [Streptomyces sp. NPDC048441]|uniref:ATP-binding protein n=1 Tax=Streptomyces sp. NPDC048441 TaxID=3365552 RepID=UPI0037247B99
MKQSAAKTLGVAALGAAFAVAGAGAANAAPSVPDPSDTLGTAASTLPLDEVSKALPAGGPEALAASQSALGSGVQAAEPTVNKLASGDAGPVASLLGGLPVSDALPLQGLPVSPDALPLG